ncbi:mevalonate kinase family protein [Pseudomonas baetica]|uniref:mevalonate kinase family protein n=1 Tax=Pseudomonas baetica TaxID=674054 RepID=UPI003EEE783C
MGEHAVLQGCPVIASSVGLYCKVWVHPRRDGQIELKLPDLAIQRIYDPLQLADYTLQVRQAWKRYMTDPTARTFAEVKGQDSDHLVKCAIGEILLRLAPQDWRGFSLRVRSQIPADAGFGSSGALAVTLVAALLRLFRLRAMDNPVPSLAQIIERYAHGQPSGIDHNTSLLGSVVERRSDGEGGFSLTPWPAESLGALHGLQIYHTGAARESTGQVIAATRHRLAGNDNPLLASMCRNTERFSSLLQQTRPMPETLKAVLRDYEADLEQLGVVPTAVAEVIRAIEKAGGAAKVCGAGALSGESAGALLVMGAPALPALERYQRIDTTLGVSGLEVSEQ